MHNFPALYFHIYVSTAFVIRSKIIRLSSRCVKVIGMNNMICINLFPLWFLTHIHILIRIQGPWNIYALPNHVSHHISVVLHTSIISLNNFIVKNLGEFLVEAMVLAHTFKVILELEYCWHMEDYTRISSMWGENKEKNIFGKWK